MGYMFFQFLRDGLFAITDNSKKVTSEIEGCQIIYLSAWISKGDWWPITNIEYQATVFGRWTLNRVRNQVLQFAIIGYGKQVC